MHQVIPHFPQGHPSFLQSVLKLVGHAIGGAVLFISLAALAWGLGWAVSKLNVINPFSEQVLSLLHGVELALLYLDIALSGIVLLVGAFRFVKEIAGHRL